jgi:hypothetical protein
MVALEDLYILDVVEFTAHLYRMGNSTWPGFTEDRARIDPVIRKIGAVDVVVANGNGFSAFSHVTPIMQRPGKKVWRIKKGARLPDGIVLVKDMQPNHEGHFMLAPQRDMPLKKYLGLLEELGMDRLSVQLLSTQEVQNARR